MSEISLHLSNNILDHVLNGVDYVAPTDVYLALYDGDPLGTGEDEGVEVSAGNYAREIISFNAPSGKSVGNSADIQFPEASEDNWGDVTHIALFDSATEGEILFSGALENPRTVYVGDTLRFQAGEIEVIID